MNTGTSGSVTSITSAEVASTGTTHSRTARHSDGEDDLRQEPGEVRLERFDPVNGNRGDLGALGAVERSRVTPKSLLHELESQLREHAYCPSPPDDLERPGEDASGREDTHEEDQLRDLVERSALERRR